MNFSGFFADWDFCIQDWYNTTSSTLSCALLGRMSGFNGLPLSVEYIPEPYFGNPKDCSAVVININPGMGSKYEKIKSIIHKNDKKYPMIYDFGNAYSACYSQYVNYYSPVGNNSYRLGFDWWQKYRMGYIDNIVKLYQGFKKRVVSEKEPFGVELCPLHSSTIAGIKFNNKSLYTTYENNAFLPAIEALKTAEIPFGLCFASLINQIMTGSGLFEEVMRWENGIDKQKNIYISGWPTKNGLYVKRTYTLLKRTAAVEGVDLKESVFFLNTWDRSGGIIKLDGVKMKNFQYVDEYIVREIAGII